MWTIEAHGEINSDSYRVGEVLMESESGLRVRRRKRAAGMPLRIIKKLVTHARFPGLSEISKSAERELSGKFLNLMKRTPSVRRLSDFCELDTHVGVTRIEGTACGNLRCTGLVRFL